MQPCLGTSALRLPCDPTTIRSQLLAYSKILKICFFSYNQYLFWLVDNRTILFIKYILNIIPVKISIKWCMCNDTWPNKAIDFLDSYSWATCSLKTWVLSEIPANLAKALKNFLFYKSQFPLRVVAHHLH